MEGDNGAGTSPRLFRVRTVRGDPFQVGGRTLTPVARVVGFGRAQGTVAKDGVSGWGVGFGRVTPVAVLEKTAEGEREIVIHDATATVTRELLAAAVLAFVVMAVIRLVRVLNTKGRKHSCR